MIGYVSQKCESGNQGLFEVGLLSLCANLSATPLIKTKYQCFTVQDWLALSHPLLINGLGQCQCTIHQKKKKNLQQNPMLTGEKEIISLVLILYCRPI